MRQQHPAVTPKPITPTGAAHYHHGPPPHSAYDMPEGRSGGPPLPPSHHHHHGYYSGMPPRAGNGAYPVSGYDSRGGSWEQQPSPNVVENRYSFDSDSSGSRSTLPGGAGGYPPYPPPLDPWHQDQQQRYPPPRGWSGYERGYAPPHHHRYAHPHQQQYYDEYYAVQPPPQRPAPSAYTAPYTYVQQPSQEEKTVLRKKFSWKNFPEVRTTVVSTLQASRNIWLTRLWRKKLSLS